MSRILRVYVIAGATSAGLLGCGDDTSGPAPEGPVEAPPGSLILNPLDGFPDSIEDVGLYPNAPDLSATPPEALAYEPAYRLWSNGSEKHRYVAVPKGKSVDTSDPEQWSSPVGTLYFKTFFFETANGDARAVETRILRRAEDGWDFAAYLWDEDQSGAKLLDLKKSTAVTIDGPDGAFDHVVPSRLQCRECHESAPSPVLGFNELSLRGDGPEQVEALIEAGAFSVAPSSAPVDLAAMAKIGEPGVPDTGDAAMTTDVVAYFLGNCVSCHNGTDGPSSSFDMRPSVMLESIIGVETASSASAQGIRIVPGSPESSILFAAFSGETEDAEVKPMPPVGVQIRDDAAVTLLRNWISQLPALEEDSTDARGSGSDR